LSSLVEVYPNALQLCSAVADPRKTKYERRTFDNTILTMAHVIIIAKLFFGLDGKTRYGNSVVAVLSTEYKCRPFALMAAVDRQNSLFTITYRFDGDWQSIVNLLPRERDWMQSLDIYDSLQTQTQIPMAFG
jgi:hypothetical protein